MNDRTMADTLRAVAEFIDAHPDLPRPPYVCCYDHTPDQADVSWYLSINNNAVDEADQKAKATAIIRSVGGKWDKTPSGNDMRFEQTVNGLHLDVLVAREAVCERVVTGTETVTLPAVEAQPERTEERDVVEWRCEPLLAETSA